MISEFSRFNGTERTIIRGNETFGAWAQQSWLKVKPDDRFIKVFQVDNRYDGRPDLISDDVYNTPLLSWVLIAFNAIHYNDKLARSAFRWPRSGSTIYYPSDVIVIPELSD